MDDPIAAAARRRRQRVPLWTGLLLGVPFALMGAMALWFALDIWAAAGDIGGALFVGGIGALFVLVGVGVIVAAILGRRQDASARGLPWPTAAPDRTGTYVFDRSRGRWLFEIAGPPIGAVALVAAMLWLITQPSGFVGVLMAAFFLVVTLAWWRSSLRRGLRRAILTVGPGGIWTPELGLMPWAAVRDVRIEQGGLLRYGRVRGAESGYRRLGIWPRHDVGDRGAAWAAVGAYGRLLRGMGMGERVNDLGSIAPYGIYEYELAVPLESVVPALARFVPVLDESGAFLRREDEDRWGPSPAPRATSTPTTAAPEPVAMAAARATAAPVAPVPAVDPDPLRTLVEAAPQRGIFSTPSVVPDEPAAPASLADGPLDRTLTLTRRSWLGLWAAADVVRSLLFLVMPVAIWGVFLVAFIRDVAAPFLLLPVAMILVFLVIGGQSFVASLDRLGVALGPRAALTIGPAGLGIRGRRPVAWGAMREIRLGRTALVEGGEGGSGMDRPRLVIVPRDDMAAVGVSRVERLRAWVDRTPGIGIDLDVLEADPDQVIDLVDRYRRVSLGS